MTNSSFEDSAAWYSHLVGEKGHHYHQTIILPKLRPLLKLQKNSTLIDIGCGQGVLERAISKDMDYVGLDASKQLIQEANKLKKSKQHLFFHHDCTKPFPFEKKDFSHAVFILSLQNIEQGEKALFQTTKHLAKKGKLFLVLNHPAFRIPRQSFWKLDTKANVQFRSMQSYMTPQKIPIYTNMGKKKNSTISFHYPLSTYFSWLNELNFSVENLFEWCSDKKSTGKYARVENRAKKEFPLFLLLVACKN